jgi:RNA ligase
MYFSMASIDINVLNEYKRQKLIKYRKHPDRDLLIWNYTNKVQMKGPWDDITNRTRGLVTDSNGNIKAHSFRKFHNIEQGLHRPSHDVSIYEKVDGSLGILFWHEDSWVMCSRGSFIGDQAYVAQSILNEKYDYHHLNKSLAYSFEIIYPENRIVVDYKQRRELVFLAAFMPDGSEVDVEQEIHRAGFPVVARFPICDYTVLQSLNWDNAEGFVVKFNGTGDRAKIKFDKYLSDRKSQNAKPPANEDGDSAGE